MEQLPKTREKRSFNKKRLAIELSVIGAIVLGIILWRFLPWFFAQPLPYSDPYEQYKSLYHHVVDYDFSKGPSADLEKRLDRAVENYNDSFQLYYSLKARIEYNYRLGNREKALEDLQTARDYAPSEEETSYVYDLYDELTQSS